MRIRLLHVVAGFSAALALGSPAARAFTMENGDAIPKFDLDEQLRNFRTEGTTPGSSNKNLFETPLGSGKLQFGVGPSINSGPLFGSGFNAGAQDWRREYERRTAPPNSLLNDNR